MKEKITYIADDGAEFEYAMDCITYEKKYLCDSWFLLFDEYGREVECENASSNNFVAFAVGGKHGSDIFLEFLRENNIELSDECCNDHVFCSSSVGVWVWSENWMDWFNIGGENFNRGMISNIVSACSHFEF